MGKVAIQVRDHGIHPNKLWIRYFQSFLHIEPLGACGRSTSVALSSPPWWATARSRRAPGGPPQEARAEQNACLIRENQPNLPLAPSNLA
jgi:hypothetical protein